MYKHAHTHTLTHTRTHTRTHTHTHAHAHTHTHTHTHTYTHTHAQTHAHIVRVFRRERMYVCEYPYLHLLTGYSHGRVTQCCAVCDRRHRRAVPLRAYLTQGYFGVLTPYICMYVCKQANSHTNTYVHLYIDRSF